MYLWHVLVALVSTFCCCVSNPSMCMDAIHLTAIFHIVFGLYKMSGEDKMIRVSVPQPLWHLCSVKVYLKHLLVTCTRSECAAPHLTELSVRLSASIWMKQSRRGFGFVRGICLRGALHHPLQPLSQVNGLRKYTRDYFFFILRSLGGKGEGWSLRCVPKLMVGDKSGWD